MVKLGLRVTVDEQASQLGAKVREARLARVNYFAVIGQKEAEIGAVALQNQAGEKLGTMGQDELIARLVDEIDKKTLPKAAQV
jgi:threonyl-tRNA synthetase